MPLLRRLVLLACGLLLGSALALPLQAGTAPPAPESARASAPSTVLYAPLVPSNVQFAESLPATSQITVPFPILDSQTLSPRFGNGRWYFLAFVVDRREQNGLWDFEYIPGEASARAIGQLGTELPPAAAPAQPRAVTPIGRVCSTQGDHVFAPDGYRYVWCVNQNRGSTITITRR